jgi:TonB dependent receptor
MNFRKLNSVRRSLSVSLRPVIPLVLGLRGLAQQVPPVVSTNVVTMEKTTVVGHLDEAREQIVPSLGATAYLITSDQIANLAQGANAPFNQVILRAPGVAQDSAANGDLHVRGEHANLQYRINDVLLPEGISGFGQELDTRFVDSVQLVTGSLPAQYGFRTAGVVDIHTKNGTFANGGEVQMYGGSYDTLRPSFEYGGTQGKLSWFVNGSYNHNDIGIENPTASATPLHDVTDQYKLFSYVSYLLDDTSRLSFIGSASYSTFQVPNTPGLTDPFALTSGGAIPTGLPASFDSAVLNENQKEQNYYGVVTYQKSVGELNFQLSAFGRNSDAHFTPDPVGDLYFNGASSDVNRKLYSAGLQADASYQLGDTHTVRFGGSLLDTSVSADSTVTVFDLDAGGNPVGAPRPIVDNHVLHGIFAGVYLQDEWKLLPKLTLNYGARFDVFSASFDHENQLSPRANLIFEATEKTTLHAGYARYFTPPPVEFVSGGTLAKFDNTSNSTGNNQDDPVKAERANYFDAGITQTLAPGLKVGVDGYYKTAKNQLDDGLFGQTLILSAFNYQKGEIYGVEFTGSYTHGGFSTYANIAYSVAKGENWNSAQFLFGPGGPGSDLAYVQNHWIALDHDQRVSGSFGASYTWTESARTGTRAYVDALYGSGLRTDATDSLGNNIPNGGTVPAYYSVNLGVEQSFKLDGKRTLKARLDVVNLTDNIYELRDGSGVGVNAAQYGMRRGLFGSLSYAF